VRAFSTRLRTGLGLGLTLGLAACQLLQPTQPVVVVITATPPPSVATFTPPSLPSATPIAPEPTITLTSEPPTLTPTFTPEPPCINDLQFIDDLTIPDGTHLLTVQPFVKKWQVRNLGTCSWGPEYRLVLVGGNALGAANEVALYPAKPGVTVTLEIPMLTPLDLGEYAGQWQARDPNGQFFGPVIFIKIVVINLPPAETPSP